MINALFVLIVFLLQLSKDKLHIKWPLGVKTNITYIEETQEVRYNSMYKVLTSRLLLLPETPLVSLPWPELRVLRSHNSNIEVSQATEFSRQAHV